jgi:hypothetical protein
MKTSNILKLPFTASLALATWLAGGTPTSASAQADSGDSLTAAQIVTKSREAYGALSSYRDRGTVEYSMGAQKMTLTFSTRLQRPSQYRIDWTQKTGSHGMAWSDGGGNHLIAAALGEEKSGEAQEMPSMKAALAQAAGPSLTAAVVIPGAFFSQDVGDAFFAPVLSGHTPLKRESDAVVGSIDCYVVSSAMDLSKQRQAGKSGTADTTLWIGKKDFLIQQCRTKQVEKMDNAGPPSEQAIDDASRKTLEMQHKPVTPEAIAALRPQMKVIMSQVQTQLKSGFAAGLIFNQKHEDIVVNEKLTATDFAR